MNSTFLSFGFDNSGLGRRIGVLEIERYEVAVLIISSDSKKY